MSCRQVVGHTFGLRLWCSAAQPTPPTPHPREKMSWWEVLAVILPHSLSFLLAPGGHCGCKAPSWGS